MISDFRIGGGIQDDLGQFTMGKAVDLGLEVFIVHCGRYQLIIKYGTETDANKIKVRSREIEETEDLIQLVEDIIPMMIGDQLRSREIYGSECF